MKSAYSVSYTHLDVYKRQVKTPISDPDFKAEAKGVLNLGMIKQVYPLGDMELNGTIDADMQM